MNKGERILDRRGMEVQQHWDGGTKATGAENEKGGRKARWRACMFTVANSRLLVVTYWEEGAEGGEAQPQDPHAWEESRVSRVSSVHWGRCFCHK